MIPRHLHLLFWDVNLDNFNPAAYSEYTIAHILEYGNERAVAWTTGTFSEAEIKPVNCNERRLSR